MASGNGSDKEGKGFSATRRGSFAQAAAAVAVAPTLIKEQMKQASGRGGSDLALINSTTGIHPTTELVGMSARMSKDGGLNPLSAMADLVKSKKIPAWKEREMRAKTRLILTFDVDLVANRSMSTAARVAIQAERNYQRELKNIIEYPAYKKLRKAFYSKFEDSKAGDILGAIGADDWFD